MKPTLSILIPSLEARAHQLADLKASLFRQIIECNAEEKVEILTEIDPGVQSIGTKRNELLQKATGEYVAFHDDDDEPARDYIRNLLKGCDEGKDCCSLRGVITWDGQRPEIFEHSIKYSEWKTNDTGVPKYERYVNHLNAVKASIAKQFRFPETNHGEDKDWSMQLRDSGLIRTEAVIEPILYHYKYVSNK